MEGFVVLAVPACEVLATKAADFVGLVERERLFLDLEIGLLRRTVPWLLRLLRGRLAAGFPAPARRAQGG
jgi:hypothetical protein